MSFVDREIIGRRYKNVLFHTLRLIRFEYRIECFSSLTKIFFQQAQNFIEIVRPGFYCVEDSIEGWRITQSSF